MCRLVVTGGTFFQSCDFYFYMAYSFFVSLLFFLGLKCWLCGCLLAVVEAHLGFSCRCNFWWSFLSFWFTLTWVSIAFEN